MANFFATDEIMADRTQAKEVTADLATLSKLSRSKDTLTRIAVAANQSPAPTHAVTLDRLAKDKDWGVRAAVAGNPFSSEVTITLLSEDANRWVRDAAQR